MFYEIMEWLCVDARVVPAMDDTLHSMRVIGFVDHRDTIQPDRVIPVRRQP